MKRLLFITTSSLAANPRLVKEIEAIKHEFICHVICFKHYDWSLSLSDEIISRNPEIVFIEIDRKQEFITTIISKIVHKCAILVNKNFFKNFNICAFANNDKALQLWYKIKALGSKSEYSRVIGHNLGAFYAAVKLSQKNNIPLQLDIEDYYPGEALYFNKSQEQENRMQIMAQSFLKADTITYASKGIQLECEKQFEVGNSAKQSTIINAFRASDFKEPNSSGSEKIKCVWFSQHIGPNRGLEKVFEAAQSLSQVEFHLIGNQNGDFLNGVNLSDNVILHDIMDQNILHEFLSGMDVGLALENVEADHNRNICLTNKFLAYAQAGLYILATHTFGQSEFLRSLDYDAGVIMEIPLEKKLMNLDRSLLTTELKMERWRNAKSFSWEIEKLKFKNLVS